MPSRADLAGPSRSVTTVERWDTSAKRQCKAVKEDQIKEGQKERKDSQKRVTVSVDDNFDINNDICGFVNTINCALF